MPFPGEVGIAACKIVALADTPSRAVRAVLPLGTLIAGGGPFMAARSVPPDLLPVVREDVRGQQLVVLEAVPLASQLGMPVCQGFAGGGLRTCRGCSRETARPTALSTRSLDEGRLPLTSTG